MKREKMTYSSRSVQHRADYYGVYPLCYTVGCSIKFYLSCFKSAKSGSQFTFDGF